MLEIYIMAFIRKAVLFDRAVFARYGAFGDEITDDNQLLAYGEAVDTTLRADAPRQANIELIEQVLAGSGKLF